MLELLLLQYKEIFGTDFPLAKIDAINMDYDVKSMKRKIVL